MENIAKLGPARSTTLPPSSFLSQSSMWSRKGGKTTKDPRNQNTQSCSICSIPNIGHVTLAQHRQGKQHKSKLNQKAIAAWNAPAANAPAANAPVANAPVANVHAANVPAANDPAANVPAAIVLDFEVPQEPAIAAIHAYAETLDRLNQERPGMHGGQNAGASRDAIRDARPRELGLPRRSHYAETADYFSGIEDRRDNYVRPKCIERDKRYMERRDEKGRREGSGRRDGRGRCDTINDGKRPAGLGTDRFLHKDRQLTRGEVIGRSEIHLPSERKRKVFCASPGDANCGRGRSRFGLYDGISDPRRGNSEPRGEADARFLNAAPRVQSDIQTDPRSSNRPQGMFRVSSPVPIDSIMADSSGGKVKHDRDGTGTNAGAWAETKSLRHDGEVGESSTQLGLPGHLNPSNVPAQLSPETTDHARVVPHHEPQVHASALNPGEISQPAFASFFTNHSPLKHSNATVSGSLVSSEVVSSH